MKKSFLLIFSCALFISLMPVLSARVVEIHVPGELDPRTRRPRAYEVTYFHHDILGSTIAITDNRGGVLERIDYDPYGAPRRAPATGNPYLFAGYRHNTDGTGLYHMPFRDYHPELGRFVEADPKLYGGGINLYSYCGSNPGSRIDPTGMDWREDGEVYLTITSTFTDTVTFTWNADDWNTIYEADRLSVDPIYTDYDTWCDQICESTKYKLYDVITETAVYTLADALSVPMDVERFYLHDCLEGLGKNVFGKSNWGMNDGDIEALNMSFIMAGGVQVLNDFSRFAASYDLGAAYSVWRGGERVTIHAGAGDKFFAGTLVDMMEEATGQGIIATDLVAPEVPVKMGKQSVWAKLDWGDPAPGLDKLGLPPARSYGVQIDYFKPGSALPNFQGFAKYPKNIDHIRLSMWKYDYRTNPVLVRNLVAGMESAGYNVQAGIPHPHPHDIFNSRVSQIAIIGTR